MDCVKSPIKTVVTGFAASMGAIIQSNGTKGRRFAWPRSKVMIHQPLINGVIEGVTSDIAIRAEEIKKTRDLLNKHIANVTGRPIKKVAEDTDRDYWMTADEALAYGMIDQIGN
jgi:ATP-dependent Clp protease protease subunit